MLIMRKYKANKRTELYSSSVHDRKDKERLRVVIGWRRQRDNR